MANYESIIDIINSTDNLVKIIDNEGQDDNTIVVEGVDWFVFDERVASKIYVSGNSWIGLGTSSEQLNICRRDGKLYTLSREVGTLYNYYDFIRIKWEGYTQYNSTSSSRALQYEVIIFSSGDILIHIIKTPTSSSYMGTSSLACPSGTKSINIPTGATNMYVSFKKIEDVDDYELKYEMLELELPIERKYLISDTENIYTINENNELIIVGLISELSAQLFLDYGVSDLVDGSLLLNIPNPEVLCWQESIDNILNLKMSMSAVPFNQVVETENISFNYPEVIGLESIKINSDELTKFLISFDNGNTYKTFKNNTWSDDVQNPMTKLEIENISSDNLNLMFPSKQIKFKFTLTQQSLVNNIVINYITEGG